MCKTCYVPRIYYDTSQYITLYIFRSMTLSYANVCRMDYEDVQGGEWGVSETKVV